MTEKIDEIDVQILNLLQARGRIKRNEIAEEVEARLRNAYPQADVIIHQDPVPVPSTEREPA